MRFCFGPVNKELEGRERTLHDFSFFHGSMINRMHEAARSAPKHAVKLRLHVEDDGDDELRPLLDLKYCWDSKKKRYSLTMDNGVTVYWWFDETEDRIECELSPHLHKAVAEADNCARESDEEAPASEAD